MITLLSYRPGKSLLHRSSTGAKLLAYLLFCAGQITGGLPPALASALILGTVIVVTKTPLSGLGSIATLSAFVILSHAIPFGGTFSESRLWRGVFFGVRLLCVGAASHLFLATTRVDEIRRSLRVSIRAVAPRFRHAGLRLYLTVRLLQFLTREARSIATIVNVRTPSQRPRPIKRTVAVGRLLIERAIPLSVTLVEAMEARGSLLETASPTAHTSDARAASIVTVLVGAVPLILAPLPRILPDFSIF